MPPDLHDTEAIKPFFDTNILLYSVIADDDRSVIATALIEKGGFVSVQVLNEFTSIARSKFKMLWPEIRQKLNDILDVCEPVCPLTFKAHQLASQVAQRFHYNIYDACILASALEARCDILYSEDMQHGQRIEGLQIINPFR